MGEGEEGGGLSVSATKVTPLVESVGRPGDDGPPQNYNQQMIVNRENAVGLRGGRNSKRREQTATAVARGRMAENEGEETTRQQTSMMMMTMTTTTTQRR